MNKRKRKLKPPTASLINKQFLLTDPFYTANNETPQINRKISAINILNRNNLTYTPMTRKLMQKQHKLPKNSIKKYQPIISSQNNSFLYNNKYNKNQKNIQKKLITKQTRKRSFSEMDQQDNELYETPIIPGSVRKKRRLNTNTNSNTNTHRNNNSTKKIFLKKLLNNQYNNINNHNNNDNVRKNNDNNGNNDNNCSMILDFDTPSSSKSMSITKSKSKSKSKSTSESSSNEITPLSVLNKTKKKKKRRLSASRDSLNNIIFDIDINNKEKSGVTGEIENNESKSSQSQSQSQMVSRRRKKRHSLSSNAIKKKNKKLPKKKLINSLTKNGSINVNIKTYNRNNRNNRNKYFNKMNSKTRTRRSRSKSLSKSLSSSSLISSSLSSSSSSSNKNKNKNKNKSKSSTASSSSSNSFNNNNICPLITNLVDDPFHPSQIALISHYCFSKMSINIDIKQKNIIKKLDSFLALLSRAEILLNNDERTRLKQIDTFNNINKNKNCNKIDNDDYSDDWSDDWKNIYKIKKKRGRNNKNKNKSDNIFGFNGSAELYMVNEEKEYKSDSFKSKRVRFCCYDLSTVTTPLYGDLDSSKYMLLISRLLVQSSKIGIKLFNIKSDKSWTRKSIKLFINTLNNYINSIQNLNTNNNNNELSHSNIYRLNVAKYLLNEFNRSYNREILYPFSNQCQRYLSSLIRFYLKCIWNAPEFLNKNSNIRIPKWYNEIGTWTVFDDNNNNNNSNINIENAEFLPYHAAEISIQLRSYYDINTQLCSKSNNDSIEFLMNKMGIIDNPFIFFNEMCTVFKNIKNCMLGEESISKNLNNKNKNKNNNKRRKNNNNQFSKYLLKRWKELKSCLKDVQSTKSTQLYFYLPLLDFKKFLNSIHDKLNT